jgi:transcription elongation factor GreA
MADDAAPAAFLVPAAQTIAARIATEPHPGDAFEAAVLLGRLGTPEGGFPTPEEVMSRQPDPIPLLNGLSTGEARRRAIEILRKQASNWRALCRETLLRGPQELWDTAIAELPETGEPPSIDSLTNELLEGPEQNLDLFSWLCRALLLERWHVAAGLKAIFEQLLTEGDKLARRKADRRSPTERFEANDTLTSIRQTLRSGQFRYFDQILKDISEAEASRLLFRVRQSSILTALYGRTLENRIIRRYPRLLVEEEKSRAAGPELIYATPAGIERRRKEHEDLVNVEIPNNSADIRRAAAEGDITDNADWRTAIEQQRILTAKASAMADELHRARPIEPSMVSTEHVSIGSRVTIENVATGEKATYAILGIWDADAERGIIAYPAPLAKAILRHPVGDVVTLDHAGEQATYRILAIEHALAR